jgi:NAD(P)-dependent dehydrogenase (short-subunit alcohol dehydrogenase family)
MPINPHPYSGQVAIVTGGASGIGRAVTLRLAEGGAKVAVLDFDGEGANRTAAEVVAGGGAAIAARVNVAEESDVAAAIAGVASELGAPAILVNSAGIARGAPLAQLDLDTWDAVINVNLRGTYLCLKHTLPLMVAAGYGRVINISSGSGVRVNPGSGVYGASKAGVIALTKAAANEMAPHGITVNAVAPGITDTPMTRGAMGTAEDLIERARSGSIANPMGVVLAPDDIAAAIAFFANPETRYITGQTLHVNAGALMA